MSIINYISFVLICYIIFRCFCVKLFVSFLRFCKGFNFKCYIHWIVYYKMSSKIFWKMFLFNKIFRVSFVNCDNKKRKTLKIEHWIKLCVLLWWVRRWTRRIYSLKQIAQMVDSIIILFNWCPYLKLCHHWILNVSSGADLSGAMRTMMYRKCMMKNFDT